jgi:hypothetical protein
MAKYHVVDKIQRNVCKPSYLSVQCRTLTSLYRATFYTRSLAKANTDAAKMRCNSKKEDTKTQVVICVSEVLHDGYVSLVFIFRITLVGKWAY